MYWLWDEGNPYPWPKLAKKLRKVSDGPSDETIMKDVPGGLSCLINRFSNQLNASQASCPAHISMTRRSRVITANAAYEAYGLAIRSAISKSRNRPKTLHSHHQENRTQCYQGQGEREMRVWVIYKKLRFAIVALILS